ncbi:MAG: hypothetical protein MPJ04_03070 [Nitrosopumilus sp.]|nr:hypothetical protein [Nitrosopumilus sp.]
MNRRYATIGAVAAAVAVASVWAAGEALDGDRDHAVAGMEGRDAWGNGWDDSWDDGGDYGRDYGMRDGGRDDYGGDAQGGYEMRDGYRDDYHGGQDRGEMQGGYGDERRGGYEMRDYHRGDYRDGHGDYHGDYYSDDRDRMHGGYGDYHRGDHGMRGGDHGSYHDGMRYGDGHGYHDRDHGGYGHGDHNGTGMHHGRMHGHGDHNGTGMPHGGMHHHMDRHMDRHHDNGGSYHDGMRGHGGARHAEPVQGTVSYYVEPLPGYSTYDAADLEGFIAGFEHDMITLERAGSAGEADVVVVWARDHPVIADGGRVVVGLGGTSCGEWQHYDSWSVTKLAWHGIGHALGFRHSGDQSNIMHRHVYTQYERDSSFDGEIPPGAYVSWDFCTSGSQHIEYSAAGGDDVFEIFVLVPSDDPDSDGSGMYHPGCGGRGKTGQTDSETCQIAEGSVMVIDNMMDRPVQVSGHTRNANEHPDVDMVWDAGEARARGGDGPAGDRAGITAAIDSGSVSYYVRPLPEYSTYDPAGLDGLIAGLGGDGFSLERAGTGDSADIVIGWAREHGGYHGRAGDVTVPLGDYECGRWLHFDAAAVTMLAWHRIGHALGFAHSDDASNVMHRDVHTRYERDLEFDGVMDPGWYLSEPFCGGGTRLVDFEADGPFEVFVVVPGGPGDGVYHGGCGARGEAWTGGPLTCEVSAGSVLIVASMADRPIRISGHVQDLDEAPAADVAWDGAYAHGEERLALVRGLFG